MNERRLGGHWGHRFVLGVLIAGVTLGGLAPPTQATGTTPPPVCTFTPGYYSNHPNAVTDITFFGLTKAQAEDALAKTGTGSDYLDHLTRIAIAAKLNVIRGAEMDPEEEAALIAASELIAAGAPITSKTVQNDLTASEIVDILSQFNEGESPGGACE